MSEIVNTEMSEFWNGDGGRKWVHFQETIDASLMPFGQEAMRTAAFKPSQQVLDIGCGCGDTTFEIARQLGQFGRAQGIDISELILERAQSRDISEAQCKVIFECADAQSHRFAPMFFDVVFSRFGVMFFDDPVMAFRNIRKALATSGRIVFICWQPIKANQWVSLPLGVVANHLPLPAKSEPEEPGAFSFGDPNRVTNILDAAGFADITIERFDASFNLGANLDDAVKFLMHMGPASIAIESPDVDDVTRARIAAELRETLAAYKTEYSVALDAATWIVTACNR